MDIDITFFSSERDPSGAFWPYANGWPSFMFATTFSFAKDRFSSIAGCSSNSSKTDFLSGMLGIAPFMRTQSDAAAAAVTNHTSDSNQRFQWRFCNTWKQRTFWEREHPLVALKVSNMTKASWGNVFGPYVITLLNWTPIIQWYTERFVIMNGHQKDMWYIWD